MDRFIWLPVHRQDAEMAQVRLADEPSRLKSSRCGKPDPGFRTTNLSEFEEKQPQCTFTALLDFGFWPNTRSLVSGVLNLRFLDPKIGTKSHRPATSVGLKNSLCANNSGKCSQKPLALNWFCWLLCGRLRFAASARVWASYENH